MHRKTEQGKGRSGFLNFLARFDAGHRFVIALGVAVLCWVVFIGRLQWGKHLLLSWDAFALALLVLAWARILTAQPRMVFRTVRLQHSTRTFILMFVLASACASLAAVFYLLRMAKGMPAAAAGGHVAFALVTVFLSWALLHTIFAMQYAYLHYFHDPGTSASGGALIFPEGEVEPDYLDFAYFSFVIGMTSQVSDVQIGSREVRRWALLHGLISFAFNTAVLALGVNVVSGFF